MRLVLHSVFKVVSFNVFELITPLLLGSILEGPDSNKLRNMVDQAYDVILAMMADPSVAVRDSAAWVVQRICQLIKEAVLIPQRFVNTVVILRQNLNGAPRVASNVCWVHK